MKYAGVVFGILLGVLLAPRVFSLAQTPNPCLSAPTKTTVPFTLFPTLTRPAMTATHDFSTSPIFQTATRIAQANQTQAAKWTASPNYFPTPTQEDWSVATATQAPPMGVRYTVLTAKGLNERQTPSTSSPILKSYPVGSTVVVYGDLIVSGGYEWGKTQAGYVAVKWGDYIFLRSQ